MIIMIGNAEAERVFSLQNRIKTKLRNRLIIETLDWLIRVKYANLGLDEFDFKQAVIHYLSTGWHRL